MVTSGPVPSPGITASFRVSVMGLHLFESWVDEGPRFVRGRGRRDYTGGGLVAAKVGGVGVRGFRRVGDTGSAVVTAWFTRGGWKPPLLVGGWKPPLPAIGNRGSRVGRGLFGRRRVGLFQRVPVGVGFSQ